MKLLRQALCVVEAVDADNPPHGRAALCQSLPRLGGHELCRVDADGKAADRQNLIEGSDAAVLENAAAHAMLQVVEKVGDIGLRLQSDQVVGGQHARKLLVLGHGEERLRRRKRNVQEVANGIVDVQRAQLPGQRHQVIVVHPDDVVGPEQRF